MEYTVTDLNNNKIVLSCNTVTAIIEYFKKNYSYKLPNFLRESIKDGNNINFHINNQSFYVKIKGN